MGKYENNTPVKKKRTSKGKPVSTNKKLVILIVILSLILVALLAIFVVPQLLYRLGDDFTEDVPGQELAASENIEEAVPEATEAPEVSYDPADALVFPLVLEDGKLEIESVLQFDGINPDCENQEGANIASITVKNTSDTYLATAEIALTTGTGEVLNFVISDLPAGNAAMAFSCENASYDTAVPYVDARCAATFDAAASMNEAQISVSVVGTHITLMNQTDSEINDIVVYCRSTLGDQYFGGITYTYNVNNLPANGTAELDAVDCFLGLAEVVRIAIDDK